MNPGIELTEPEAAADLDLVRYLHVTDEDGTHTVRLPRSARIAWPFTDNDPKLRIEPGEGFEEFQEDDGLIGVLPEHIVEMARMGVGGLVLMPGPAGDDAHAKPPTRS